MRGRRLIGIGCVLATVLLAVTPMVPTARAETVQNKIDPALRERMQAHPLSLLPIIVEMEPATAPTAGAANVDRANEAMDLLRLYGTPVAGLALIDSAAGFANAPGIEAISLSPTVAYVQLDATVAPARGLGPVPPPPSAHPPPPLPLPTAPPTPAPTAPATPAPTAAPTSSPTLTPTPAPSPTPSPQPTPPAKKPAEELDFAARLLRAKKKAMEERDKNK